MFRPSYGPAIWLGRHWFRTWHFNDQVKNKQLGFTQQMLKLIHLYTGGAKDVFILYSYKYGLIFHLKQYVWNDFLSEYLVFFPKDWELCLKLCYWHNSFFFVFHLCITLNYFSVNRTQNFTSHQVCRMPVRSPWKIFFLTRLFHWQWVNDKISLQKVSSHKAARRLLNYSLIYRMIF